MFKDCIAVSSEPIDDCHKKCGRSAITTSRQVGVRTTRVLSSSSARMSSDFYALEFRRHQKITNPLHIMGFIHEWKLYLDSLPANPNEEFSGRKLDPSLLQKVSFGIPSYNTAEWLTTRCPLDVARADWPTVRADACHERRVEAGPIRAGWPK